MDHRKIVPAVTDAVLDAVAAFDGRAASVEAMTAMVIESAAILKDRLWLEETAAGRERLARVLVRGATPLLVLAVYYASLTGDSEHEREGS